MRPRPHRSPSPPPDLNGRDLSPWRKPIVFGLSVGLLLMTIGWILDRLPDRPRLAGTIAWTLGVSPTIEVGLITVQAWRSEASHSMSSEETNATIFALMGAMVGIMSLCLFAR